MGDNVHWEHLKALVKYGAFTKDLVYFSIFVWVEEAILCCALYHYFLALLGPLRSAR